MKILIAIVSVLAGLMFGGIVTLILLADVEWPVIAKVIIFAVCSIIGTWGIYREINGE